MAYMRTNSKLVKAMIRDHVLSHFGTDHGWDTNNRVDNLRDQVMHMTYANHGIQAAAIDLVEGGTYCFYYVDCERFLNDLGINPTHKQYSDTQIWRTYVHLLSREIVELVK